MDPFSPELLAVLFLVGTAAGFVDSIAGGGGLLALPVLLWTGLDPASALGTNKLQGSFGTLSSSLRFVRSGHVDVARLREAIFATFIGSALGSVGVQFLHAGFLERLIPIMLIAFAVYFLFSPRAGDVDAHRRVGERTFAWTAGLGAGFYDGFFGPGAGSFFAIAFVALLGYNLRKATAHTKVLNLTSNLAALLFFAIGGHVVWVLGLVMGAGQFLGAQAGSHMVITRGAAIVKPLLVIVSLAISAKLLMEDAGAAWGAALEALL
jgi:uncharacterized membrane protein YfcA